METRKLSLDRCNCVVLDPRHAVSFKSSLASVISPYSAPMLFTDVYEIMTARREDLQGLPACHHLVGSTRVRLLLTDALGTVGGDSTFSLLYH